jgi:hypothetical protein
MVIVGLLTGGVLAGRSLIKAAELRSVSTEFMQYQTAVNVFQEKYNDLPGDMTNATEFWGRADTGAFSGQCADPVNNAGSGTQTCNGNGNGKVGEWGTLVHPNNAIYYESYRFWQHLANAGLISGTFTGIHSTTQHAHAIIGENVPASSFPNGGWTIESTELFAVAWWPEAFIVI